MDQNLSEAKATRRQFLDAEAGRFECINEPDSFKTDRTYTLNMLGTPTCYVDVAGMGDAEEGRVEVRFRNIADMPEAVYVWAEVQTVLHVSSPYQRQSMNTHSFSVKNVPVPDKAVADKVCAILEAWPRINTGS